MSNEKITSLLREKSNKAIDIEFTKSKLINSKDYFIYLIDEANSITSRHKSSSLKNFEVPTIDQDIKGDLSNFTITESGIVEEQWTTVENVLAQIIEVTKESVILECLVDTTEKIFEHRSFDILLFEKLSPLTQFKAIVIKIFRRPGEIKFQFLDGEKIFDKNIFDQDFFKELSDDILTKPFE